MATVQVTYREFRALRNLVEMAKIARSDGRFSEISSATLTVVERLVEEVEEVCMVKDEEIVYLKYRRIHIDQDKKLVWDTSPLGRLKDLTRIATEGSTSYQADGGDY